jgi:uncharacterized protein (TIGR02145 family)
MEAEGIEYSAARIGSQVWTTENMRHVSGTNSISVNAGNGVYSHNDDISNDKTHGKYYTWSASMRGATREGAQGICASGWHIPTNAYFQWSILENQFGRHYIQCLLLPLLLLHPLCSVLEHVSRQAASCSM